MGKSKTSDILMVIAAIIVVIMISYGAYLVNRRVNYSLSYEDMVQQTVREMVKKECLNETP